MLQFGLTKDEIPVVIIDFNDYEWWSDEVMTAEDEWEIIESGFLKDIEYEYQYHSDVVEFLSWEQACEEFWPEQAKKDKEFAEQVAERFKKLENFDLDKLKEL